ncbi:hypothetical protein WN55_07874 [Dufourea novaeangliae]|uniref:Transposable element Tc3 transposase n=1 Tax=Dufourea novaeangliae TaxID=178035 RepID=A0A154PSK6_DUFNO|nr:hypothetical protein WN55_07874 [Dufourea novaeangliae]
MWYQHDGCPAHYAQQSRQVLRRLFPNRWIGREGEISWSARLPDLTPFDYFLWRYLKNKVYREPTTTPEDMRSWIIRAFNAITEEIFQRVSLALINRLHTCIDHNE